MDVCCVYCERNVAEVVAEEALKDPQDALDFYLVKRRRVLLCGPCHHKHAPKAPHAAAVDYDEPVTFPPGVTRIGHICPELIFGGYSEDDATVTLTLEPSGDYLAATCPHCGILVRSLHAEPDLDEDDELDG